MFSSVARSFLFPALVIFLALPWEPKSLPAVAAKTYGFCIRFRVFVKNGLSNNAMPLQFHCWSKDDDLGKHTLYTNQDFNFRFFDDFMGNSLFTCDMRWGDKHKKLDVYAPTVEGLSCCDTGNCYWRAQDDGIYFCNDDKSYLKRWDWEK
ncbi:hypothetical protein Tsubulata_012609 [Turnera subulata]|uniref:S-protein homolog n=1 Tax=Turnera subulata TaxID=218843 RepID=A0A9Q0FP47_9ROSI|nr:hypothetical protein Tsubulata_012609 [Turnera subulata]